MATINNLYIHVTSEDMSHDTESTTHPVEQGLPITSTIQMQPLRLSLQGYIVDTKTYSARIKKDKLAQLQERGSLVTYKGRTTKKNLQIQSFTRNYTNAVAGGMAFTMELKEVRIAKPSYKKPSKGNGTSNGNKDQSKKAPVLKVGATVVFKGGNVYVSSDAKKAAAKRGRSTCKITIINNKKAVKHPYHLISKDGGKVYGWVDKANIEGLPTSSTGNKTSGGTKQPNSNSKGKAVYHTVKKGDTIYNLVNKNYKSLGKTTKWVIDNNPKAFSKKGDPKTLKVGAKLLMGYKK